jgi:hypothetical protein
MRMATSNTQEIPKCEICLLACCCLPCVTAKDYMVWYAVIIVRLLGHVLTRRLLQNTQDAKDGFLGPTATLVPNTPNTMNM